MASMGYDVPSIESMTYPDSTEVLPICKEEMTPDSSQSYFTYNDTPITLHKQLKNVILFGETGVGKSALINLLADRDVAETSSNIEGCTREARGYFFTLLGGMFLRVFDTVGLEESELDSTTLISAIRNANNLIRHLKKTGRIDLLLFCIKAGRFTASMQSNYYLLSKILCKNRVPVALVITHLENEVAMEGWWQINQGSLVKYGIDVVGHACIASLPKHVTLHGESRRALWKLFQDALGHRNLSSYVRGVRNRLATIFERPLFLLKKRSLKRMKKKLEKYCSLPGDEAHRLAQLILDG